MPSVIMGNEHRSLIALDHGSRWLGFDKPPSEALVAAATRRGLPLKVTQFEEPELTKVYGRQLLLVRPDQHIAWRGVACDSPRDAEEILPRARMGEQLAPRLSASMGQMAKRCLAAKQQQAATDSRARDRNRRTYRGWAQTPGGDPAHREPQGFVRRGKIAHDATAVASSGLLKLAKAAKDEAARGEIPSGGRGHNHGTRHSLT